MTQPTPPGWYPDPSGTPSQRYFDGKEWTEHRAAAPASTTPPPYVPAGAKKRIVWPWVLLGVLVLFFGGCAALVAIGINASDRPTSGTSGDAEASVGQEVRDGKFSFVVTDVSTPEHWYGTPTPRGEWVIATMTVTNTGNEPQSFFANNQKLIDSAGREYAADAMAAISMNNDSMVIDLNPGFNITVRVPFDVPPGTQLSAIELHDSAFSGGATVKLP
jgi:hypothetical protein